jgi:hypothetical protein
VPTTELTIVRDLARQVRDIAAHPRNIERQRLWRCHNDLEPERVMVLAELGGVMGEFADAIPVTCTHPDAAGLERELRTRIYNFDVLDDDRVISGWLDCPWQVQISSRGVAVERRRADNDGHLGSFTWDPALKTLPDDLARLHPRSFEVDHAASDARLTRQRELVDDILPVRRRGGFWWTTGLTWTAIELVGLEQMMLLMFDQPDDLHALFAFLRDDQSQLQQGLEAAGVLTPNDAYDYIGSGSVGYTAQLRTDDAPPAARLCEMWGLSESQETVGISPAMFGEFVFPYQQPVIEQFGLAYYGCCEPVHDRWPYLSRLRNLRKVSVSPWCDEEAMGEALGSDYVYCRKPNPTMVSCESWDEDAIRTDLRRSVKAARGPLELVMKDVHTVNNEPDRLRRWVELARQESSG